MFFRISLSALIFFCNTAFAFQQLIVEPDMGKTPLINAIQNAKSSVDLVMYGFTDLKFVDALDDAKQKNKTVRVLLQHYPFQAHDENQRVINELRKHRITTIWPDEKFKLTHQKTFLIDNTTAIVMTFNLTHSTFSNQRNFALLITDPNEVQEIKKTFESDWQHKNTQVKNPNLLWSPDNSREKILSLINNAKNSIQMYAAGLSDYKVIGALAKAARSGVQVKLLTTSYKKNDNHHVNRKYEFLNKTGVEIRFSKEYIIHAKAIIIDNDALMLGSINFTKPSIDNNRELSIITHDAKIISQIKNIFNRDWQHATRENTPPAIYISFVAKQRKISETHY